MASDPGAVTPQGIARRRFRRRAEARAHLAVAQAPSHDVSSRDDIEPAKQARAKRSTRTTAKGGTTSDFVRANARVLIAIGLLIVGIVIVLLGWYGAANTNILTEQVPYLISGGLLGMALIIVAAVVGSSASLERDNRELRRDLTRLLAAGAGGAQGASLASFPRRARDEGTAYVVPGGRSYHFAGCPIIEGKNATEMPLEEAIAAGHGVCKLCGPD
ncbi:MAG: hypothetical protein ACRDJ1_05885 [Actinomycetota bacterium]